MKTNNLVEELTKSGIRAAAYKRPPIGKDVFALTILPRHKEGVVTVNQGKAKVQVWGDKKRRQAAVTVTEPKRVTSRSVNNVVYQKIEPDKSQVMSALRQNFPVVMPRGTKWRLSNEKVTPYPRQNETWRISGVLTATVGRTTTNHFLIGMDETRNFISPLPRKVTSVTGAHRVLKPKYKIRKGSIRQGEWFFVPCTKAEKTMLEKLATSDSERIKERRLERTTHTAKSCIRARGGRKGPAYYARGYITDNRTGHHKSLFLKTWHKVVKNKEATIKVDSDQRVTVHRRRATWD